MHIEKVFFNSAVSHKIHFRGHAELTAKQGQELGYVYIPICTEMPYDA